MQIEGPVPFIGSGSGSGIFVVEFNLTDTEEDSTTVYNIVTTSGTEASHTNKPSFMDLSVTAGVFMVLMIAIATAILLCCCKVYVICKRRQRRQRQLGRTHRTQRGGIHQHLPLGYTYSDEPPSYADILSGKIASTVATQNDDCAGTMANCGTNPKSTEESIAVHWSCNDDDADSIAPPLYSCVVFENEHDSTIVEVEPPSYQSSVTATNSERHSRNSNNIRLINSVSQKVFNVLHNVSTFVKGNKESDSSLPSNDPTTEISCDGNVMRTVDTHEMAFQGSSMCFSIQT